MTLMKEEDVSKKSFFVVELMKVLTSTMQIIKVIKAEDLVIKDLKLRKEMPRVSTVVKLNNLHLRLETRKRI